MSKPTVAILVRAADARARVAAGVLDGFAVCHCTSVNDLHAATRLGDLALVVIDAVDATGGSMASAITSIRHGFPTIPILAYCTLSRAASAVVLDVARAGVTGLVFQGVDDERHAMREAIRAARHGSVTQRVYAEMAPCLPSTLHALLRYAIGRRADAPSVDDAARALGVDRKTLFNWLRPCGQVGPREFINWIRLSIAVGMLEDPRRTAEQVALELGFASGAAFRNMLQRYAAASCSDMRGADGLPMMLAQFKSRLTTVAGMELQTAKSLDDQHIAASAIERPA